MTYRSGSSLCIAAWLAGVAVGVGGVAGCGTGGRTPGLSSDGGSGAGADLKSDGGPGPGSDGSTGTGQEGCGELQGCYTVFAHGDHELYRVDLPNKMLVRIGGFQAPKVAGKEDVITDLAVAPDDTVWAISNTQLYTVDRKTAKVTLVGPVKACGAQAVALTFSDDGTLYAGDYKGAFCRIDTTAKPPTVTQIGTLGGSLAIAGDIVAVADGTMYATAYDLNDKTTDTNNLLVKLDPKTGKATKIGPTGFPKMFGVAFAEGKVFGFTHDGSGAVVTIDPKTGQGTLYNKFTDPVTMKPISFAGAGVNSKVAPTIM